ncbi:universal stress protein [Streptomyces sp. NPDC056323]|uniref:universal stress protein n=1 Tax=Streptomyces sp. NPDC056323 TaxID=3345784 RepID=UPI0035DF1FE0
MPYKHLLVVVDLADGDDAAVEYAVNLAKSDGVKVKVAHLLEPIASIPTNRELTEEETSKLEAHIVEAHKRMEPLSKKYPEHIKKEELIPAYGPPHMMIGMLAKEWKCDLVVVGDRSRRVQDLVSPAPDDAAQDAMLDVLVVRTQKRE